MNQELLDKIKELASSAPSDELQVIAQAILALSGGTVAPAPSPTSGSGVAPSAPATP